MQRLTKFKYGIMARASQFRSTKMRNATFLI